MTGFVPRVGSNRSTNWATTTSPRSYQGLNVCHLTVVLRLRHLEVFHLKDWRRRWRARLELSVAAERQRSNQKDQVSRRFHPVGLRRLLESANCGKDRSMRQKFSRGYLTTQKVLDSCCWLCLAYFLIVPTYTQRFQSKIIYTWSNNTQNVISRYNLISLK